MITSNEIEAFLRDGLTHYADARDAVEHFEREVRDRLAGVLESKDDWRNFKPKRGERGRGKAVSSNTWISGSERAIFAIQAAAEEGDGSIELGLWWRSPRKRDGALAYCSRWRNGSVLQDITLFDPKPPVVCEPINGSKRRLYIVLDQRLDFASHWRLLLDEMDRALGLT